MPSAVQQPSLEGQTPYQRLRSLEAAKAIKAGRLRVPYVCGWCQSENVERARIGGEEVWHCLSCSRDTSVTTAKRLRQQTMRSIIAQGIDLPRERVYGRDR